VSVSRDSLSLRVGLGLASAACVAVPFLLVSFPPCTDLPQHVAQVRLFLDAFTNPDSAYRIQWLTPYSLVYTVLGAAWAVVAPLQVGRVALAALAVWWTAANHLLASRLRRPPESAAVASILFFSPILYWGFLSFAMGWPVFVLWFLITTREAESSSDWKEAPGLFVGAVLLYVAHALWFAAGMSWLALESLVSRRPLQRIVIRLLAVSPVVVAAAIWYPKLAAAGFVSATVWQVSPIGHLSFSWLVNGAFGGLWGATEYAAAAFLTGWLWLGWRARAGSPIDRRLLAAGAMFFAFALLLPYEHMNTIEFAQRWLPPALILALLALPAPAFDPFLRRFASVALVFTFCAATTMAWLRFDHSELSGLREALAAAPRAPRLLGLDFVKDSKIIKKRPFLQIFAYTQVLRGGQINFSFADFAPSLVINRSREEHPWTVGLEWEPEHLKPRDLEHFDYVLVNGTSAMHDLFRKQFPVAPLTEHGRWRLYRITGSSS